MFLNSKKEIKKNIILFISTVQVNRGEEAYQVQRTMLRKRSRPVQKDQTMSQVFVSSTSNSNNSGLAGGSKIRNTSSFTLPGLFIGFNSKSLSSDVDSVRSPTSPLDYKVFSNLSSSFVRSPRVSSSNDSPRKSWDCNRVGLSLVDSLSGGGDSDTGLPGKVVVGGGFLDNNKNIIFGPKLRINLSSPKTCSDRTITYPSSSSPKSLPKNYVISSPTSMSSSSQPVLVQIEPCEIGKIHSCSADIGRKQPSSPLKESMDSKKISQVVSSSPPHSSVVGPYCSSLHVPVGSFHELITTLSANDIESSEDYTRIISRGPNPKTTHIFGDCILESHPSELSDITILKNNMNLNMNMNKNKMGPPLPFPIEEHFLSYCYFCKKKLVDGEDIYMYRYGLS